MSARYVHAHPGTLNLDVDLLRTFVGGWREQFEATGELIRPVVLVAITEYLAGGHDVVFPQLLVDNDEISKFESAATRGGGEFIELALVGDLALSLQRFHDRDGRDNWTESALRLVAENGGDELLREYQRALDQTLKVRPRCHTIDAFARNVDDTYAAVVASIVNR